MTSRHRRNLTVLCLAFAAQIFATPLGAAAEASIIKLGSQEASLEMHGDLSYLVSEGPLQIADVFKPETLSRFTVPTPAHFSYTKDNIWLKFVIYNKSQESVERVISLSETTAYHVNLYTSSNLSRPRKYETGSDVPYLDRPMAHRAAAFRIDFAPLEKTTLILEIKSYNLINPSISVLPPTRFYEEDHTNQLSLGLYYGVALALILYNLILFVTTRDRSFLYYIVFVSSTCMTLLVVDGLADIFLSSITIGWQWFAGFWGTTSVCLAIAFARVYLQTARRLPGYDRLLKIVYYFTLAVGIGELVSFELWIATVADLCIPAAAICVLLVSIASVRSGFTPAKYFLTSWSFLMLFSVLWLFSMNGQLPSLWLAKYGVHLGSAVEMILMSLGLGHRMSRLGEEKLLAESKLAESRATAQTAQMIAHDVRRPFSMLRILVSRLNSNGSADKDLSNDLEEINQAIDRSKDLLSAFIQLGSDKEMDFHAYPFISLIWDALGQLPRLRDQVDVKMTYDFKHEFMLRCDRSEMVRVVTNIFENALDAMADRGRIWIRTRGLKKDGMAFCEIVIGNDGPEIPAGDKEKIFQISYTRGKLGGSGLGLAISQRIVRDHGGDIYCQTPTQGGCEFVLSIPMDIGHPDLLQNDLPASLKSAKSVLPKSMTVEVDKNPVIAIVDDCPFIRSAWRRSAKDEIVLTFKSPEEFWAYFETRSQEISVVVTDIYFGVESSVKGEDFALKVISFLKVPVFISTESEAWIRTDAMSACIRIEKRPHSWDELGQAKVSAMRYK